ncbi:hypothetical protein BDV38DRAFT_249274 [Aspergillus pseudotamarii]|uniref:Uncharacterized protein n=1 Tax=Aspergillus pseudotamarii TaxID=132259 RepID=A0A5N6SPQ2_ASPPS|nr:uncharacterized protein BDV38DRAFT_249274 [Aspergillus pseudotamarii]KAE8136565.1 hypothetical protein BDV38DRAFT_249274 [Aspergillus pseudotamarii]
MATEPQTSISVIELGREEAAREWKKKRTSRVLGQTIPMRPEQVQAKTIHYSFFPQCLEQDIIGTIRVRVHTGRLCIS